MRIISDGRKHRTESELRELILRYEASGLTQSIFCKQEGIGLSSLHKWLKKYGGSKPRGEPKPKEAVSFVEFLGAPDSEAKGGSPYQIELELPHGITLRLSQSL